MIGALVKIAITVASHLLLFTAYPDTDKYGQAYLWISLAIWSTFWLSYQFKFSALKNLLFPLSFLVNVAAMAAMIFFITLTMPQEDGQPVISKLAKMRFPDQDQINRGKIKYLNYLTFSGSLKEGIVLKKAKEAIKKAKEEGL